MKVRVISFFVDATMGGATYFVVERLTENAIYGVLASLLVLGYGVWNFILNDLWVRR